MHSENIERDVNDKLIVKSKPKDNYYNFSYNIENY